MKERKPAEVFPPGEFLREELEARGWTQGDLASILAAHEGWGFELRIVDSLD